MKKGFVRSLRAANRLAVPAVASLLAAMAASFSPSALAQTLPGSIALACSAPTSTGNTADLSTAAGTWGISNGSSFLAASSASNGNWSSAAPVGSHWIGANDANAPVSPMNYSLRVVASDPNIALNSAKINYSYFVDNSVTSISWNGNTLPSDGGSTSFNGTPYSLPTPASVFLTPGNNTLLFATFNGGGPYGVNANITLTFNCAPPVLQTAPANAPWGLWLLAGLMLASVAVVGRRGHGRSAADPR